MTAKHSLASPQNEVLPSGAPASPSLLTDGYASMKEDNQEQLKQRAFRTLAVLFGGKTNCPEFAQFGEVVRFEEVTA